MTFNDYINSLSLKKTSPRVEKIREIADACCKDVQSVYRWVSGRGKPSALDRKVISSLLNMPESELFPSENVKP